MLKEGRFKLVDKKDVSMTMDIDPFPLATINMVSMLAKCKRKEKDSTKCHHGQTHKQTWRPKLEIVKKTGKDLNKIQPNQTSNYVQKPKLEIVEKLWGKKGTLRHSVVQILQFP